MSDAYLGEIKLFAGNFAPVGFVLCNGQTLPISQYDALYSLLGTTFGGDGVETFCVPDLRGRTPIHAGQGQGLSQRLLGDLIGSETVPLTIAQMPAHQHTIHCKTGAGSATAPTAATWAAASTDEKQYSTNPPNVVMSAALVTPAGNGEPHDNMAPYVVVNFIIATEGIYPPQS